MTLTLFVWWSISPVNSKAVTNEYFPQDQFTVYRTDRPPSKQGQSHGGVLIAVTYEYFQQDQFTVYRTDRPPSKQCQSNNID
jgi:hypothetical protein